MKAGYQHEIQYQPNIRQNTTTTKNSKKNKLWFNPPYSAIIVTKVTKYFLSLLDKHFSPQSNFYKIF